MPKKRLKKTGWRARFQSSGICILSLVPEPAASKEISDLDFDLGFDAAPPVSPEPAAPVEVTAPVVQEPPGNGSELCTGISGGSSCIASR